MSPCYYEGVEIGLHDYPTLDLSINCDARVTDTRRAAPAGALIHTTSGLSSAAWLLGESADRGTPASCGELIRRNGAVVIICPENRYPYHAGRSRARIDGREYTGDQVSEILFGWEIECLDIEIPTYEQVDSLAQRICVRARQYQWRWPFVILGHYSVAIPVGRRSDPRGLDWGGFMGRLYVHARAQDIPGLV